MGLIVVITNFSSSVICSAITLLFLLAKFLCSAFCVTKYAHCERIYLVINAHFGLSCCLQYLVPSRVWCVIIDINVIVFDEL